MILFIDFEHRILKKQKPEYYDYVQGKRERTRLALEVISNQNCRLVHFTDSFDEFGDFSRVCLIVVSGNNSDYAHYSSEELEPLRSILKAPPCPVFTICGSFQQMVQVHGGTIGPIGEAVDQSGLAEDPILPSSMMQENGFIEIEKMDTVLPPFSELQACSRMLEHHYWEVKELPEAFLCCARSEICRYQAVVHRSLPLAGVQFHPEDFDEEHQDGRVLLESVWSWASYFSGSS